MINIFVRYFVAGAIILATGLYSSTSTALAVDIIDIQPYKQAQNLTLLDGTAIELINLNSHTNSWYLLRARKDGKKILDLNIENLHPSQEIVLDQKYLDGIVLLDGSNNSVTPCPLWTKEGLFPNFVIPQDIKSKTYTALCEGHLWLRNQSKTFFMSNTEQSAATFRNYTSFLGSGTSEWGLNLLKEWVYTDSNLEEAESLAREIEASGASNVIPPADLTEKSQNTPISSKGLGIAVEKTAFQPGSWYPAKNFPGIYLSMATADMINPNILKDGDQHVNPFDGKEQGALTYLVAMDLSKYKFGWAAGVNEPKVGWSRRAVVEKNGAGPDGINSRSPLTSAGMVNPELLVNSIGTFSAGFLREHGAFKSGNLATINQSSHYGFIENGVVFSRLNPGLATFIMYLDGSINLKTWTDADNTELPKILHARQNGVPLIENGKPGEFVNNWGNGNWSGTANKELRSLRAATCLRQTNDKSYLFFAYFSSTTPTAMARLLQAYGCNYAIHLDMNSLGHTFFSLFRPLPEGQAGELDVETLVPAMKAAPSIIPSTTSPRYTVPDHRDFFYIMRK